MPRRSHNWFDLLSRHLKRCLCHRSPWLSREWNLEELRKHKLGQRILHPTLARALLGKGLERCRASRARHHFSAAQQAPYPGAPERTGSSEVLKVESADVSPSRRQRNMPQDESLAVETECKRVDAPARCGGITNWAVLVSARWHSQ